MYDETEVATTNSVIDFNMLISLWLIVGAISGVVTLMIAKENGRNKLAAFVAGFFMGILGIATYAIMGETIELRIKKEEAARRKLNK